MNTMSLNMNSNLIASQVKVPQEFFAKSKLEYSDWRWAFFRELIQNAYDAGATEIFFDLELSSIGTIKILCCDNGCGMNKDVLQNVLLALGGSKKPDGSIGGFGYAKSLLFFAHKRYSVRTGHWLVDGIGGEYEMRQQPTSILGTAIEVEMESEGYSLEVFKEKLSRYASYLMLPRVMKLYMNSVELKTRFNDFEYSVPTALGDFSFKEVNETASSVVIAVRGLPMFVQRIWSTSSVGFSGLLELSGDSLDLLTANRDALKGTHSEMLNRIVQQMIENRHAFKGGTTLDITLNFTNAVALENSNTAKVEQGLVFSKQAQTLEDSLRYMENEQFPKNFQLRLQNTVGRGGKDREDNTVSVTTILATLQKAWVKSFAMAWKFSVYSVLASEYGQKIGVKYYREDGTLVETNVSQEDFEKGAFYVGSTRISTGFIFAKDTEGLNAKPNNGSDIMILCNPTMYDKKFLVGDLLDLAIHETSHLCVSGHGEVFVDVDMKFRRSFRRLMNETELKLAVKTAINNHKSNLISED